jgi:hypothetical protein
MERRRDERNETNVLLTCRMPARPCSAVMHDLSHMGCRLQLPDATVELGGTALIELPGAGRTSGLIVWTRGNVAGVEFHHRLEGAAAIALGLDEPEPETATPEPGEQVDEPNLRGILRHWIRRLTGSF